APATLNAGRSMKRRAAVYSASRVVAPPPAAQPVAARERRRFASPRLLVPSLVVALAALLGTLWALQPRPLTEKDVEGVVKHTLDTTPPPPSVAPAYEKIIPSAVGVRALADDGVEGTKGMEAGQTVLQRGTGVIIVDSGL